MAFPAQQGTAAISRTTVNGTSITPTLPSGIVSGEMLLAIINSDGGPTLSTTSTGWNKIGQISNALNCTMAAFVKLAATGSDALVVNSSASEQFAATVKRISGHRTDQDPTWTAQSNASSVTDVECPSHTSPGGSAEDILWNACAGPNTSPTVTSAPTNYGNFSTQVGGGSTGDSVAQADRQLNAASEDPGPFVINVARQSNGATISIRPAPSGATETTGSSAGTGSAVGTGVGRAQTTPSAAGAGAAAGTSGVAIGTQGGAAGVGAAAGTGQAQAGTTGAALGAGAVSGAGQATATGQGAAAGQATPSGSGSAQTTASGAAAGAGSVQGVSGQRREGTGAAAGQATVVGASGSGVTVESTTGSAAGGGQTSGTGTATATGEGSVQGEATTAAEGRAMAVATAQSAGQAGETGVGRAFGIAQATMTGQANVQALLYGASQVNRSKRRRMYRPGRRK